MVDVVGLHYEAGELLLDVPVLVAGLGRTEGAEVVVPVADQPVGDEVKGLVPACLTERAIFLDEGSGQAVWVVNVGSSEPALDAEHSFAGTVIRVVLHGHYLVVGADLYLDAAAYAAIGAGGGDALPDICGRLSLILPTKDRQWVRVFCDRLGDRGFGLNGARGAYGEALPAGGADGLDQGLVHKGADAAALSGAQEIYGADELVLLLAGVDAAGTEDAGLHADAEDRVAGVRLLARPGSPAGAVNAVMLSGAGQLPVLSFAANGRGHGRLGWVVRGEHGQG